MNIVNATKDNAKRETTTTKKEKRKKRKKEVNGEFSPIPGFSVVVVVVKLKIEKLAT